MRSVGAIVLVVIVLIAAIWVMKVMEPRMKARREEELRKLCETRLGRLAAALQLYLERYDNLLPPPQNWCDALEEMVRRASGRSSSIAQNLRAKVAMVTPLTPTRGTTSTMSLVGIPRCIRQARSC